MKIEKKRVNITILKQTTHTINLIQIYFHTDEEKKKE